MGVNFLNLDMAEQRAKEIAEHSAKRENWYIPGQTAIPGDLAEHVMLSGNICAVFCWTVAANDVRRHLSVSVPGKGKLPLPSLIWTLAHLFGFTGAKVEHQLVNFPARSWKFQADDDEGCVVVQEIVKGAAIDATIH